MTISTFSVLEVPGATHTDPGRYWDWLYYDTLVDNLTTGFRRGGPYQYWWFDSGNGFGTYTTTGSVVNWGRWTPNLPRSGLYEVKVYIPSGYNAYVRYRVYHRGGVTDVWVNQANYSNQWVSLGIYEFDAGYSPSNSLTLGDTSNVSGRKIAFDAAVWIYRGSLCGDVIVDDVSWIQWGLQVREHRWDTGFRDLDILLAMLRKGSNRTTRAMYKVRMIGRDTILYLNQYSSSLSDTGWFYLGEVCTDTFLVTLYDQAPDGSVVIADGIKFQWNSSACYTGTSEEEKRENWDMRFEGGRILVLVPKRGDFVYVEQTFEGNGVYFVVVEFDGVRKVKKLMLKP